MTTRPPSSTALLDDLVAQGPDAEYRADGRGRRSAPRRVVGVVLLVAVVTAAAVQAYDGRGAVADEREVLIQQVEERRTSVAEVQAELEVVRDDVETLRGGVVDTDAQDRLAREEVVSGAAAVTGPGLSVVVDDAPQAGPDDGPSSPLRVRDTDLQVLVNGLWGAGAEAVAINGDRITSLSAIHFAGNAITVNFGSLTAPYTVEAVGDPDTMAAAFLESDAGTYFSTLSQNYDLQFDASTVDDLELAAAPTGRLTLRHARVLSSSDLGDDDTGGDTDDGTGDPR